MNHANILQPYPREKAVKNNHNCYIATCIVFAYLTLLYICWKLYCDCSNLRWLKKWVDQRVCTRDH